MINANIIHILVLYTISYGSLIIPQIHFHIQYFTISNQFNYAHKFSSVLQFNSVMKINSVMQINLIMPINSVMQINLIMPINSVMQINLIIPINSVMQINLIMSINSVMQINLIMPINSVIPLTNLTYVFDIHDIRVTSKVPLGCRPVSHGFITQYGPAGLLTGYKQSNSEHYRYSPAGLLIGVTHQYNSSQYCYLTLLVYQSILNTN